MAHKTNNKAMKLSNSKKYLGVYINLRTQVLNRLNLTRKCARLIIIKNKKGQIECHEGQ